MSARSELVGKKSSRPYLGPSEAIFSMDRENAKNVKQLSIFPWWALAAIHPGWGNRYFSLFDHLGACLNGIDQGCSAVSLSANMASFSSALTLGSC